MPSLPLIGVQSSVGMADVAGGAGSPGSREIVGGALGMLGAGAQAIEHQKAIGLKQAHDEATVAITNAHSAEVMASTMAATEAANSGQMPGFVDRWGKDFDARVQAGAAAIPKVGQEQYKAQMAALRGQLQPRFYQQEMGARNLQLKQDTTSGIDTDADTAFIDPSQGAELIARRRAAILTLAIPDDEKQALLTRANQTIAYGAEATRVQNDPAGWLARVGDGATNKSDAAVRVQSDPTLSQLKPESLQTLTNHARMLVAQRAAARDHAADQAEENGRKAYNDLVPFANSGQPPSLDYVSQVSNATLGTSFEAPARELLKQATAGAGFGAQSLPRQAAWLSQFQANTAKEGTSPERDATLAQFRTINQAQQQAYKDNPWEAAARFARMPVQPAQQITAPEQGAALIQQRLPAMAGVESAAGAPVSPLQPTEAAQWGETLAKLPVSARAETLSAAGQSLSAPQINALADQLGNKDKATGLMLKLNDRTNAGRSVSELVGKGAQALADKTVKRDDAALSGWRSEIAGMVRGTLGNTKAEDDVIDAAYFVRAATDIPGIAMPGFSGPAPTNEHAIRLVIGQPVERGGVKTLLPRGMDEGDFDTKLRAMTPDILKAQASDGKVYMGGREIPLNLLSARLTEYGMTYAGPGSYIPTRGNTLITVDKAGTMPLRLKVQ